MAISTQDVLDEELLPDGPKPEGMPPPDHEKPEDISPPGWKEAELRDSDGLLWEAESEELLRDCPEERLPGIPEKPEPDEPGNVIPPWDDDPEGICPEKPSGIPPKSVPSGMLPGVICPRAV